MTVLVRPGLPEEDMPAMEDVFRECFPPGWYFGKVIGTEYDYLVLEVDGQVVGFAALTVRTSYLAHMAVLRPFRAHTLTLWQAMLTEMRRFGDVWSVNCRPTTMYKFLIKRRDEHQVSFLSDETGKEAHGEVMRQVTFRIAD
jgi:hypothetical protein